MAKIIKYNKLVRDKIPEIIRKNGKQPVIHTATKKEYWEGLKKKLKEEIDEFLKRPSKEELADILEVIDATLKFKGIKKEELKKLRKEKLRKRGGFKKRIILDKVIE